MSMPETPQVHSNDALTYNVVHVALQQMALYHSWQASLPARAVIAPANYHTQLSGLAVMLLLPQDV